MDDNEYDYLTPSFDPNSVTVPRLRSILVTHDIQYPASAKKPDLINLFNEQVVPQANKILKSRTNTKPTKRGISNAPMVDGSGDLDDDVAPSVEDPPRRSSKRVTSTPSETSGRRTSSKKQSSTAPSSLRSSVATDAAQSSGSERDTPKASRKGTSKRSTRHSLATPMIKEEEDDAAEAQVDGINGSSPFTSDNPFQGGSSALYGADSFNASKDHRRRTVGLTSESKDKKKTPTSRRKTDFIPSTKPELVNNAQISSSPAQAPESLWLRAPRESEDIETSEAGEEFTPEEQEELELAEAQEGQVDVLPPRQRKQAQSTSPATSALKIAPWAILLAMLGGFATVWRREKIEIGYCGVGKPQSMAFPGVDIPEVLRHILPECKPCPQHAYCSTNLDVSCETGFVLQPHPLSLGGVVPLPPTCEPDGEKARKVKAVADRAVRELRGRNAKYECGDLKDEDGGRIDSASMGEQELKNKMSRQRRKGMSQNEFEDLWHTAIGEIQGREEVTSGTDGREQRTFRSSSLARISLACAVRRSVRLALARHIWKLVSLATALGLVAYTRYSIIASRGDEATAKRLASFALDRLATQAALHSQSPDRVQEPWISMGQLRDDVLRDEFSARRRQRLWVKVQKKVEANSNVRARVAEAKTGEVSRVWEWIGAIEAIEDPAAYSKARRESSRFLGGAGSPLEGSSPHLANAAEQRRWDEGRPIY